MKSVAELKTIGLLIFVAMVAGILAIGTGCVLAGGTAMQRPRERDNLVNIASAEHACPPQHVRIVAENWNHPAIMQLNVCGQHRVYRDMRGSGSTYYWIDTTGGI